MADQVEQWVAELLRLSDEDEKFTEKQLKIVQAAIEMFSEKGYAATSTSEIAQRAGVAEGTIFRHYKTKKDLLVSIVAPVMSKLVAPFVLRDFYEVLDSNYVRYEDFVRALLQNRLEFAKKYFPILKIMIHEIPFQPELQSQFKEHVGKQVIERIRVIVERFQAQGQIVDMPPYTVMRLTASTVIGYLFARFFLVPELDWDDPQEMEYTVRFIMQGLRPS
ncbi:TetR/AcrR family transcriptional regulator [Alicyclobacillus contaminans]|uniref:TetR/AcrR family transcriptional regulator n=1 Tax=Alicyclobacillus contaminans TaxID=392016 RepID=UPI00047C5F2A|nr:TetR/AcrR family transcriptional regulator [Alicyclobacillus contaminans]